MLSRFTAKSVERTDDVLKDKYAVFDLTFFEWEQKHELFHYQKLYVCNDRPNKKQNKSQQYYVILKIDRLSTYTIYRDTNQKPAEDVYNEVKIKLSILSDGITSKKPTVVAPILRDIVNNIRNHPNWTCAHIAAKCGLERFFIKKSDQIIKHLNDQRKPDNSTPLQLAIESGKMSITRAILALKPRLELKDEMENAAIHYAAMSTKECLQLMLKESNAIEMLRWKNINNCTPLHLSCFTKRYSNVFLIMSLPGITVRMLTVWDPKKDRSHDYEDKVVLFKKQDLDDLDTEDMQFGGTPLHWVRHRRTLERLINLGFDLNVRNIAKETALHIMVKRLRLKCLIGLLCFGAKVNRVNKDGDTPLHCSVRISDITATQALTIFDSNIDIKNHKKESPLHLASQVAIPDHNMIIYLLSSIGAKRCPSSMKNCKPGCAHNGTFNGNPYHRWPTYENQVLYRKVLLEAVIQEALHNKSQVKGKGAKMLCLDGGGVRGLITVQIMIELEKYMKETNLKDSQISNHFNWIAGTSTGSILGLLLSTGRSLDKIRSIYFRLKDKILVGPRPYSSKNFENLLEQEIGGLHMCEVMTKYNKHLIINATLIDRMPAKLHIFRSYESPEEVMGLSEPVSNFKKYPNCKQQVAWRACRASGAAPTYFRSSGPFLDGGLMANNPTLDALSEHQLYQNALKAVGRQNETQTLDLVLSLGTGRPPIVPMEPVDLVKLWSYSLKEWYKNTAYLKQMFTLMINQVTATEGHITDRVESWCCGINTPYFRLNPILSEDISLNETSDVEICNGLWETMAYLYSVKDDLKAFLQLLLPNDEQIIDNKDKVNKDKDEDKESTNNDNKTGYQINISKNDIEVTPIPQSSDIANNSE
ncbi:85/88 kDa calcium-independent phospholipase A2-like [Oppia nitens]|uniref:85/88 kDa calcium-independent phospholipase A2-like n=1 Tax=Oppia nitens TaxID=1686743 RepID=UPI0023DB5EFC|nr:85/88 kDa calcium-independent phospholipase A2-like [Oppia nitens]